MTKKISEQRPIFPFTSIVGQEEMFELKINEIEIVKNKFNRRPNRKAID